MCSVLLPKPTVVKLVSDKRAMTEWVSNLGVPCPAIVASDSDCRKVYRENEGVGSKGVRFFEGELPAHLKKRVASGEAFVQEEVLGQEYTVDVLCDSAGAPLCIVPRERVEVKSGVCTKARIVKNESIIDCAKRIADRLKIPGFSNIQFIIDGEGLPYFIEVNPRFGGGSAATLLAAQGLFDKFLSVALDGMLSDGTLNQVEVKWGAVVTRFYSEVLYEG